MVTYAPELLILVSIDIFLLMSLLACLFDTYFPTAISYILQLAALAGFGQIYVSKTFLSVFTEEVRFWYSFFFLLSGLACVLALNTYLVLIKRKTAGGIIFLGGATVPTSYAAVFVLAVFLNNIQIPLFLMPPMPINSLYLGVVLCIGILCSGIMLALRPDLLSFFKITKMAKSSASSGLVHMLPSEEDNGADDGADTSVSRDETIAEEPDEALPLSHLIDQEQVLAEEASREVRDE